MKTLIRHSSLLPDSHTLIGQDAQDFGGINRIQKQGLKAGNQEILLFPSSPVNPVKIPFILSKKSPPAYILLELVIALSIFAIAVLGLANSLSTSLEVANILNRENAVQIGMRSFIEELRKKTLADMTATYIDPNLGVTYTSKMEPLGIRTSNGNTLSNLYDLQVTALYTFAGEERTDTVSVYVYKTGN